MKPVTKLLKTGLLFRFRGLENYPYIIYFNLSGAIPELLKEENQLQVQQEGYCLKVENEEIYLYTMPYLKRFTEGQVENLKKYRMANIKLANGWYSVSILGGFTVQSSGLEPTFEFVIKPSMGKPECKANIVYSYKINP